MTCFPSRTLSIFIDKNPKSVYEFVSNLENLPKWATTFVRAVNKVGNDWIADTPQGQARIRMAEKNALGIVDHYVSPSPDVEIFVPMRVLPNANGSEILFTLFQTESMSDEQFRADTRMVEADLATLKFVLEN